MKDAVVEADCVIPPLREDDPLSSDSELDDEDDAAYAKGVYGCMLSFPGQSIFKLELKMEQNIISFHHLMALYSILQAYKNSYIRIY